jgi:hypothetical protein
MKLSTRRIEIAGVTPNPDTASKGVSAIRYCL